MTVPISRCECCDLPAESCGKAVEAQQRREAAIERARKLDRPGWFPANYGGTCSRCGERFDADQPIHRDELDATLWRCCP